SPRHVLPFFFSSRRRHTRSNRDWSSDVCSSDLLAPPALPMRTPPPPDLFLSFDFLPRSNLPLPLPPPALSLSQWCPRSWNGDHRSEERRVGKECRSRRRS